MPMMRRGPLARYDAEWVLRQASASDTSGSVEFHTDRPLTLYLRNGRVCHAVEGVTETGFAEDPDAVPADEATARERVVELVTVAMGATDGWYYLDPIGHHTVATPWDWDGASLILDARIRRRATENRTTGPAPAVPTPVPTAAAPPAPAAVPVAPAARPAAAAVPAPLADRRVQLVAPDGDRRTTLTAEAWRIVCTLATARESTELHDELGWTGARFDAALSELAAAGVLAASPVPAGSAPVPAAAPAAEPVAPGPRGAGPAPAAPRSTADEPAPVAARPLPPTVPGSHPKPTVGRRSALRRLISNLKPA